MKPTGMIRRLDDLGRIVIPKEIRRTNRLSEGTPLEIFTEKDGEIILKKYSPMKELSEVSDEFAESLSKTYGHTVCICDRDQIIAAYGNGKKDYLGKGVSKKVEALMRDRKNFQASNGEKLELIFSDIDKRLYTNQALCPIIARGDAIGCVMMFTKEADIRFSEAEYKSVACAALFLGKRMELD